MLLLRQILTLTRKNLLILLIRHKISTPLRALVLPVVLAWFLTYARNLFSPPSIYGIGSPQAQHSLQDALSQRGGGRNVLALVDNGYVDGPISNVVSQIAEIGKQAEGVDVQILPSEVDLLSTCKNSLAGASACIAGVVFHSSPSEGTDSIWNYTLRADSALGAKVDVTSPQNDQDIYILPLQNAVDSAIASTNGSTDSTPLGPVLAYPFTSLTETENDQHCRISYIEAIIKILAVAFFVTMCGVTFHLSGMMASERESLMSQLMECMMPNNRRWEPQLARLMSYHLAFSITYFLGWLGVGIVLAKLVFTGTSATILIILHIIAGLSLTSFSIFGAAFFQKAQLSGVILAMGSIILSIIAQFVDPNTGAVVILSLLFPPMTYVFSILIISQYERQDSGTNLLKAAPNETWAVPLLVLLAVFMLQALIFPILGALVERWLYGTTNARRLLTSPNSDLALDLHEFTKRYVSGRFAGMLHSTKDVVAVNNLTLKVRSGQIMVLLGANGSGKSTSLAAIAGLTSITSGTIAVSNDGGIGFCPQSNVLLGQCTVEENVSIFTQLKSVGTVTSETETHELIKACGLSDKRKALASSLSGGQMRKLQLCLMFTGGSQVCLVDECSSGVDALARRRLQSILLRERNRSNRTIVLSTHFLDEAEALADNVAIMSKGSLRVEGTVPDIKASLGGGYHLKVYNKIVCKDVQLDAGATEEENDDHITFNLPDSASTASVLAGIETHNFSNYQISGPSIENAFIKIADEMKSPETAPLEGMMATGGTKERCSSAEIVQPKNILVGRNFIDLHNGRRISSLKQWLLLLRKRMIVFRRNPLPNVAALLIPIVASALTSLYLRDFQGAGCSPGATVATPMISSLATQENYSILVGPSSWFSPRNIERIAASIPKMASDVSSAEASQNLSSSLHMIDDQTRFEDYIIQNYKSVSPGGFFLGDEGPPTMLAYRADTEILFAAISQNALNNVRYNHSVATQYQPFAAPFKPNHGSTLQFSVYLGLSFAIFPAFFSLYPTRERLSNVRALQYSNGVRAFPLWLAYTTWDFLFVLAGVTFSTIILSTSTSAWYHLEYLFVVFLLYGLASILYCYAISLFVKSQLAGFAISAATQAVMFILSIVTYVSVLTFSPVNKTNSALLDLYFTRALVSPSTNLARALFISLNVYSITCRDTELSSYPGGIVVYGGPILYLIGQALVLMALIVWRESGGEIRNPLRRQQKALGDAESKLKLNNDVSMECARVQKSTDDGLRVLGISKSFKSNIAVEDVTFGIRRGEVFAVLGPNGAGKSTIINIIRGELRPSRGKGDVLIEGMSIKQHRASARQKLGVCPQFDATDSMTVLEHLWFYAKMQGLDKVEHNVNEILRVVGLKAYQTRLASKLSGGNKRKLSLGIALLGNPSVLILDEPSCGMDIAAKRQMWKLLESVKTDRSILLTTHSMEEADALSDRAGIVAQRMLAVGTSNYLRQTIGDLDHVHLVMKSAPRSTSAEMEGVQAWLLDTFPDIVMQEDEPFRGQIRFTVPATRLSVLEKEIGAMEVDEKTGVTILGTDDVPTITRTSNSATTTVLLALEHNKDRLGIGCYSLDKTRFDDVFAKIVQQHNVLEEQERNERIEGGRNGKRGWLRKLLAKH